MKGKVLSFNASQHTENAKNIQKNHIFLLLSVLKKKRQWKEIFRYNKNKMELKSDTLPPKTKIPNGQK